jgi:diguanylate cyclase (GGDEF)-like protein
MLFDVRTAMFLAAFITLMLAVCLAATLNRQEPPVAGAVALWVRATALQPFAWLLLALRDYVPDLWSIVLGNALICFAYAEYPRALRLFTRGHAGSPLPHFVAGATLAPVAAFTWIWPSVAARTVVTSLAILVLFALAVCALVRGTPRPLPRSHAITAAAFFVGALLLGVRAAFEGFTQTPLTSGTAVTPMQVLIFGYSALAPVLMTFGFVLMCNDRMRAELERLAATDPLTGVWNRRMLEQLVTSQLADARRHFRPVSALLIDADHFKLINDGFGHDVGDAALKALAADVRSHLRPGDLIGRLGGEEFLVVLAGAASAEAVAVAERLRESVAALAIDVHGIALKLSISIGVATLADTSHDFGALVRRADEAMYEAKRAGRNRVSLAMRPAGAVQAVTMAR